MGEAARGGSRRAWFRAVIRAVAVAEGWGAAVLPEQGVPPIAPMDSPWPAFFVRAAQACAAAPGMPKQAIPTGETPLRLEYPSPSSLETRLLIATPELLLNANCYGHRRAVVQSWGQSLGWTTAELVALEDYFQLLCQGLAGPALGKPSTEPLGSALAPLQAWVGASQGQLWLALALAQRQGASSAQLGLVGLFTILALGPAALPWALSHRYLSQEALGDRWLGYHDQRLTQLADDIYYRWAGVGPRTIPRQGTAYNG